jgi:hypothetical protein
LRRASMKPENAATRTAVISMMVTSLMQCRQVAMLLA